ncbi:helix-turn-helix domain-containing protein [Marinigracilibium pacificum]|uniref:Helix-turn-helix transcriptional regulator n=1 Tax=Marinigracilibium pacificum TaxID=2729599 RepID=A0A848ITZ9_9BACT|nr:AraC family transcriptional regulator [Marinigracilibium pacificum]NMM47817.1 helix-turn-helix transcriptional regulator [Marinigracilibium pacificum]
MTKKQPSANVKMIHCKDLHVAAMIEADSCHERTMYYPSNYLVMVEQGVFTLETEDNTYIINEGEFALIRKYTHGQIKKSFSANHKNFKDTVFVLQDEFIKEVIKDFKQPENYLPCTEKVVKYDNNYILEGLKHSLQIYFTGVEQVEPDLIRLKTKEAIYGILKDNPNLIHIFNEFSEPEKANLSLYMEHNFFYNIPLETFAKNSGRSLSTFNREFRKVFNQSPSKWLKKRRLNMARNLIESQNKRPSDVYLEVGFEDLAHFSRSFKSEFGINPSEIYST